MRIQSKKDAITSLFSRLSRERSPQLFPFDVDGNPAGVRIDRIVAIVSCTDDTKWKSKVMVENKYGSLISYYYSTETPATLIKFYNSMT